MRITEEVKAFRVQTFDAGHLVRLQVRFRACRLFRGKEGERETAEDDDMAA